jgi:SAM-dependent methyltransferase
VAREAGARLVGLDVVAGAVADAALRSIALDLPSARFRIGGFTDTGLRTASCAAVMSVDALWMVWDKAAALAEVARVLRPGGTLSFVEHGLAPDERERRRQRRLNRVNLPLSGCVLDRDVPALVAAAGLRMVTLNAYYHPRFPRFLGHLYEGRAEKPVQAV